MFTLRKLIHNSGLALLAAAAIVSISAKAAEDHSAFLGRWALSIPGGGAGWLGVTHENGYYDASLLWGAGSVLPVASVFFSEDGQSLYVTRINEVKRKGSSGKVVRTQQFTEALVAKVSGDELSLTRLAPRESGEGVVREEFSG